MKHKHFFIFFFKQWRWWGPSEIRARSGVWGMTWSAAQVIWFVANNKWLQQWVGKWQSRMRMENLEDRFKMQRTVVSMDSSNAGKEKASSDTRPESLAGRETVMSASFSCIYTKCQWDTIVVHLLNPSRAESFPGGWWFTCLWFSGRNQFVAICCEVSFSSWKLRRGK